MGGAGINFSLAQIDSMGENDALHDLIQSGGLDAWIGLRDTATEGTFVWESGNALGYARPFRGNDRDKDCVGLRNEMGAEWEVRDCITTGGPTFVCEASIVPR